MKHFLTLISVVCGSLLLSGNYEVLAKTNKKNVTHISDLIGDFGGSGKGVHKKAPNHNKLVYHYVLHNGRKRTQPNTKINLYLYSGTRKVHITGLPVVSNVTSNINKKQYHKLINPNKFD